MDAQLFTKVSKRIERYKNEMVAMQKHLVPIKAISPASGGKGEWAKAKFLEPIIHSIYDEVKEFHTPYKGADGGVRPNYMAVLKGTDSTRTMWIMAHIDIVHEGDIKLWNTDPFTAVVKNGNIYGRGTEDNHQAIVSGIFVAKAFKEESITPPINIGLLLVSDEENGSDNGVKYMIQHNKNLMGKNDLIIVPDAGDPKGETIEVAEKSTLWIKVTTKGKQSHGSKPDVGINAHRVAANFIIKADEFYQKYNKRDKLFDPPYSTFEPTKKESNVPNVNTIPGEDIMYFDCRLLPDLEPEVIIGEFKALAIEIGKKFGAQILIDVFHMQKAAPPTSPDCDFSKAAARAMKEVNKVDARPIGIGGNTVAQQFRELGLPVVVCSKVDGLCHQPNEYCTISNMVADTKVWAHIALQYNGAKG